MNSQSRSCLLGTIIDIFGVADIVIGIVWATVGFPRRTATGTYYDAYKVRIGRSRRSGAAVAGARRHVSVRSPQPILERAAR